MEKEICCGFCGKRVITKHFETYVCDECYLDHMFKDSKGG